MVPQTKMTLAEDQHIEWKESWGRGIEKIFAACTKAGFPAPHYHDTGATLRLTFPYAKAIIDLERGNKLGESDEIKLSASDEQLLNLLREKPETTIQDMLQKLQKSQRTIERSLAKLQKAGLLLRVGSRKSGSWQVLE